MTFTMAVWLELLWGVRLYALSGLTVVGPGGSACAAVDIRIACSGSKNSHQRSWYTV